MIFSWLVQLWDRLRKPYASEPIPWSTLPWNEVAWPEPTDGWCVAVTANVPTSHGYTQRTDTNPPARCPFYVNDSEAPGTCCYCGEQYAAHDERARADLPGEPPDLPKLPPVGAGP